MAIPRDAAVAGVTGYLAPPGCEVPLREELGDAVVAVHERLMLASGPPRPAYWAANVWRDPVRLHVASVGEAVRALRAVQRNWACYAFDLHRRCALIEAQLPPLRSAPLVFPTAPPPGPLGSWTLLDRETLLMAADCREPVPHGAYVFEENRTDPPSRAYLKLWESFTRLGVRPRAGERCLDLGAAPGGWTWVLAACGANVLAVDKAPLARDLLRHPNVTFREASAFALTPAEVGPVDWWCSDVICYPDRLLRHVRNWLEAGVVRNFVCTLKFQGATDHATARAFAAIPGSRLFHLHHNRHELTWVNLASDRG